MRMRAARGPGYARKGDTRGKYFAASRNTASKSTVSKMGAMRRVAAFAAMMLLGLWSGAASAIDYVRVETIRGQVVQGRLVGNTVRDLLIDVPGSRAPVAVPRQEIRRFSVVGPERPPAPLPVAGPAAPVTRLPGTDRVGALRISGANSMGVQLMPALLLDYGLEAGLVAAQEEVTTDPAVRVFQLQAAESARRLRVQVSSRGSSNAFADLLGGQADIGMSTRRASDVEARALQGNGQRTDHEQVVGLGGVVIIVHRDNPLRTLSIAQLRELLSGAMSRWPSGGGGSGLPVTVYALDRRSGEFDAVQERVLGPGTKLAPQAKLFESHEDLADAVAADPSAIGFVGVAYARNARPLGLEQECGLSGDPTPFQLKTEEYPLSRRLYLYTSGRASPLARDMMAYAGAARAQGVVQDSGFVNLDPLLASPEDSAAQLAGAGTFLPEDQKPVAAAQVQALREMLGGARRLSVTFRFEAGRADLDARAEADLERLAQWARQTKTPESALALIGHASPDGQFASNLDLSRARAQSVADRLRKMGVTVPRVEGVGPVNQVVCSRNAVENDMNRRVEVWVR
jgi:phosphate transport system substrate-binding protein